jgi:hypothetical protein
MVNAQISLNLTRLKVYSKLQAELNVPCLVNMDGSLEETILASRGETLNGSESALVSLSDKFEVDGHLQCILISEYRKKTEWKGSVEVTADIGKSDGKSRIAVILSGEKTKAATTHSSTYTIWYEHSGRLILDDRIGFETSYT